MTISIVKRDETSQLLRLLSIAGALVASIVVISILLLSAGVKINVAFLSILDGAFGSFRSVTKTLARATPLILTGLAATVAFRAKIWNIGAEGQLFSGAISSYALYYFLGPESFLVSLPFLFLAGFAGAGLYGAFAGYLRTRFDVNIVLSTVMLNYLIAFFLSYLLTSGPWRDQSSFYQQTPRIEDSLRIPNMFDSGKLHFGFVVAVIAAIAILLLLTRTSTGYEINAVGHNSRASMFKGINVDRNVLLVMFISGGAAGLAGVIEVYGVHYRLKPDISLGFGFTGIIIAILALLNPIAVIFVAIALGALSIGGIKMQVVTGIPSAITTAMEAIILLFFLMSMAFLRYKIVWRRNNG